jgi:hypothetical protein
MTTRKTQKGGKRRRSPPKTTRRKTRFNRTMSALSNALRNVSKNVPSDSTKLKRMKLLNVTNQDMNRILKQVASMKK